MYSSAQDSFIYIQLYAVLILEWLKVRNCYVSLSGGNQAYDIMQFRLEILEKLDEFSSLLS